MAESEKKIFSASSEEEGKRADVALSGKFGCTRNALQIYIRQGFIKLNGKPVNKNYLIRAGDVFECEIPLPVQGEAAPENIPLEVIFEDADIIIINKPRGMVVHPAPGHGGETLVNALLYHCGGSLSGINGKIRPGIVHRLDKDTSGLIAVAKNDPAHKSLASQLAARTMKRVYQAIIQNNIKADEITIDFPISRHPVERKKMTAAPTQKKSREARTFIKVLERFGNYTLIEAKLETGRTHQIRAHTAHIGHPLLGDSVYGSRKQPFGLNGQILHAKTLTFIHPSSGEIMTFETDLPDYFLEALNRIKK